MVACGVVALAVLTFVGLWTRAGCGLLGGKTVRTPVSLPTDVSDAQRSLTVGAASAGRPDFTPR